MRVYGEGLKYMPCPNNKGRWYSEVAQQRTAEGKWHCTACGEDHITEVEKEKK
jgi:hypothetical protein